MKKRHACLQRTISWCMSAMYCHPLLPFMGVKSSVYKDIKKKKRTKKCHCIASLPWWRILLGTVAELDCNWNHHVWLFNLCHYDHNDYSPSPYKYWLGCTTFGDVHFLYHIKLLVTMLHVILTSRLLRSYLWSCALLRKWLPISDMLSSLIYITVCGMQSSETNFNHRYHNLQQQ